MQIHIMTFISDIHVATFKKYLAHRRVSIFNILGLRYASDALQMCFVRSIGRLPSDYLKYNHVHVSPLTSPPTLVVLLVQLSSSYQFYSCSKFSWFLLIRLMFVLVVFISAELPTITRA